MNIQTNLSEDYVNFVDTLTKQITCLKINKVSLINYHNFVFFLLFKYLND